MSSNLWWVLQVPNPYAALPQAWAQQQQGQQAQQQGQAGQAPPMAPYPYPYPPGMPLMFPYGPPQQQGPMPIRVQLPGGAFPGMPAAGHHAGQPLGPCLQVVACTGLARSCTTVSNPQMSACVLSLFQQINLHLCLVASMIPSILGSFVSMFWQKGVLLVTLTYLSEPIDEVQGCGEVLGLHRGCQGACSECGGCQACRCAWCASTSKLSCRSLLQPGSCIR